MSSRVSDSMRNINQGKELLKYNASYSLCYLQQYRMKKKVEKKALKLI